MSLLKLPSVKWLLDYEGETNAAFFLGWTATMPWVLNVRLVASRCLAMGGSCKWWAITLYAYCICDHTSCTFSTFFSWIIWLVFVLFFQGGICSSGVHRGQSCHHQNLTEELMTLSDNGTDFSLALKNLCHTITLHLPDILQWSGVIWIFWRHGTSLILSHTFVAHSHNFCCDIPSFLIFGLFVLSDLLLKDNVDFLVYLGSSSILSQMFYFNSGQFISCNRATCVFRKSVFVQQQLEYHFATIFLIVVVQKIERHFYKLFTRIPKQINEKEAVVFAPPVN